MLDDEFSLYYATFGLIKSKFLLIVLCNFFTWGLFGLLINVVVGICLYNGHLTSWYNVLVSQKTKVIPCIKSCHTMYEGKSKQTPYFPGLMQ